MSRPQGRTHSRRISAKAKAVQAVEQARKEGNLTDEVQHTEAVLKNSGIACDLSSTVIGSALYAVKPGDGSAREQAASCQRVLGGAANFAREYATKRYRSNCINWGILPFLSEDSQLLSEGTWVFVKNIRDSLKGEKIEAYAVKDDNAVKVNLSLGDLTSEEAEILREGCLINFYQNN